MTDPKPPAWAAADSREERPLRWRTALDECLGRLGRTGEITDRKSAPWKVAIAAHLRETMGVPNGWLADHLQMESPGYVSKQVGLARNPNHPARKLAGKLKVKGKR